ncbi:MAG: ribosome silencing factor [Legionellales bacterium]|nr:ribosome silencing factor [Legionellales bacterium]
MEFEDLKKFITSTLDDLKATDIVSFDVRKRTSITDMMIICTGNSSRHVKSIANNLAEKAKAAGLRPLGIEGESEAEWVLVDFGDAIVHVMQFNTRQLYQLELLWK